MGERTGYSYLFLRSPALAQGGRPHCWDQLCPTEGPGDADVQ